MKKKIKGNTERKHISLLIYIIGAGISIGQSVGVYHNIYKMTLGEMFISFTLLPMLIAFTISFVATLIDTKEELKSVIVFCTFVYIFNYWISNMIFTTENMKIIYKNSDLAINSIKVNTEIDIGNIISTACMIYAIGFVGFYMAKKIKQVKRRNL